MGKTELLEEAHALDIEGIDESYTVKQIQGAIDEVLDAALAEASTDVIDIEDSPWVNETEEVVEESSPVEDSSEPVFNIGQFKDYAEQLFGVGYHVLVGAQSAGCFPADKMTREQAKAGIERYLSTPITNSEEG